MNIYIDFDGTLYDTSKFFNDFIELCNKYKVTAEDVYNLRNKNLGLFNLDELALNIKNKYNLKNSFIKSTEKLYNKKYLYKDTVKFLKKYYKNHNLYILSYGETNYQSKKINCCNIKKYFKDIIITQDKSKENIDYKKGIFIDNNPKEIEKIASSGATKIIRIKRYDDRHFSIMCNVKVKEFFALSDIDMI